MFTLRVLILLLATVTSMASAVPGDSPPEVALVRTAINTAAAKLGYARLKDKQYDAIEGFISGRDVFVCLPTGCGKSLC